MEPTRNSQSIFPAGIDLGRYEDVEKVVSIWLESKEAFWEVALLSEIKAITRTINILFTETIPHLRANRLSVHFSKKMLNVPFKKLGYLSTTALFKDLGWTFNNLHKPDHLKDEPNCPTSELFVCQESKQKPELVVQSNNRFCITPPLVPKPVFLPLNVQDWHFAQQKLFTDATLIVDQTEFAIHRLTLAKRSDYFWKMFSCGNSTAPGATIDFGYKCSSDMFRDLLCFIYTNKTPHRLSDFDFCLELYSLTDFTHVTDLKALCISKLSEILSTRCLLPVALIASIHRDETLMDRCRWFVKIHSKFWQDIDFTDVSLQDRLRLIELADEIGAISQKEVAENRSILSAKK